MRIELNCSECGQNRFSIVRAMDDDEVVYCSDCGHEIGTMAQLKERIADEVMKRATGGASN
jgi:predicted nucleic acid-binding Zn ribbon protein